MNEHEEQLDEVLAAYLEATEKGWAPNRQRLLECYPHLTDGLAHFFAMQDRVDDITLALRVPDRQVGSSSHSTVADTTAAEGRPPWPHLPGYLLLGELGSGGMGVVYRAMQQGADREVAVKMLLGGARAGRSERDRFRTEIQAVARLQHPGIVQLFEVGESDGCPYFSMEYVAGGSLADRLDGTPMSPADAVRLVETVAKSVDFAHQHGILHRDLKPANVLLQAAEGKSKVADRGERSPQAPTSNLQSAIPKIADFGLAKKLGDARHTATGAILGTPSYMAPEQARSQGADLGPATDVYALGTILYECLTGRPPFKAATPMDTLLQVVSDEPVPPTRLQPKIPRELETVCLKCLQKAPGRRYTSAGELADDLNRFQRGEPVRARPVGAVERAAKWVRRNPVAACLLAGCVSLLATLMVVLIHDTDKAKEDAKHADEAALVEMKARYVAEAAKESAESERVQATSQAEAVRRAATTSQLRQYASAMHQFQETFSAGQFERAREVLSSLDKLEHVDLLGDPRGFEWGYYRKLCDSQCAPLSAKENATLRQLGEVTRLLASPHVPLQFPAMPPPAIKAFAAEHPGKVVLSAPQKGTVNNLTFDASGKQLVGNTPDGAVLWQVDKPGAQIALADGNVRMMSVAVSPDGWYLAGGEVDGTVRVWDTRDGKEIRKLGQAGGTPAAVSFSPDGKRLACAFRRDVGNVGDRKDAEMAVKIWDAQTGERIADGQASTILQSETFEPFRGRLASLARDKRIELTPHGPDGLQADPEVWRKRLTPVPQRLDVAVLSRDGKHLATAAREGTNDVAIWDAATGKRLLTLRGHDGPVHAITFTPCGKRLATGTDRGKIRLWDTHTGQSVLELSVKARVETIAFSPDGSRMAAADQRGDVTVWDAAMSSPNMVGN